MTKRFRTLAAVAAATAALAAATSASATPITATIRVEGVDQTVIPLTQQTTDARVVAGQAVPGPRALTLLADVAERLGVPYDCQWGQFGCFVDQIGAAPLTGNYFWLLIVNDLQAQVGFDGQTLASGDRVVVVQTDFTQPTPRLLEITVSADAVVAGATFTVNVRSYDTSTRDSVPAAGAQVSYGSRTAFADAGGNATFMALGQGTQSVIALQPGTTRSGALPVCTYTNDPTACSLPAAPAPAPTPTTPTTPTAPLPATTAQADTVPPASRITTPRLFSKDRHVVRLGGAVAPDRSDVASVQYALAKLSGTQCRFRQANGKLGALHACTQRTWLPARGGAFWTVALHAALAPGRYRVWSRATDGAGNQERSFVTGSSSGTFTVVQ